MQRVITSALALITLIFAAQLSAQATRVADIRSGTSSSSPEYITEFGGNIYFEAYADNYGREMWTSDGTSNGTQMMDDHYSGGSDGYARPHVTDFNGWSQRYIKDQNYLYFSAYDNSSGWEIWRSNGSPGNYTRMTDMDGGSDSSDPHYLVYANNRIFFRARHYSSDYEPWYAEANSPGSYSRMADIRGGSSGSYPNYMMRSGQYIFFTADDYSSYGRELWRIDTNNSNVTRVQDIYSGGGDSNVHYMTPDPTNNAIFFRARNSSSGYELWYSDGTSNGTRMVKDIRQGGSNSSPEYCHFHNGLCYFSADDGQNGRELWVSDGTTNGTVMLKDINPAGSSSPQRFSAAGNLLYFRAYHPSYGDELWVTDGTEAGTRLAADIRPGPNGSSPEWFREENGAVYFNAHEDTTGRELYRATAGGLVELLADVRPGPNGSSPYYMTYASGYLYFSADDGNAGRELFRVAVPPSVLKSTPEANTSAAQRGSDLEIKRDQQILQNSVDSSSFVVHASQSGLRAGSYSTSGQDTTFDPDADYMPGEEIEVILTKNIENTFQLSPSSGHVFRFRAAAAPSQATFDAALLAALGSGVNASDCALADFDGDGALDVAISVDGALNRVFFNDGSGGFTANNSASFGQSGGQSSSLAAGDIDGDGDVDIVIANREQSNYAYFNDGSGDFSSGTIPFGPGVDDSRDVVLSDLNGDGELDVVVANFTQQNLVHINGGAGDFRNDVRTFGTGFDDSTCVAVGDFDNNGAMDIALGNLLNVSRVYFNNRYANFSRADAHADIGSGAYFTSSIAVGDVNGDDRVDIALGNRNRRNIVLYNQGGIFPDEDVTITMADATEDVLLADLNGDGELDFVVANAGAQNRAWINDGMGGFGGMGTDKTFGSGSDAVYGLSVGDVDGDDDLDLALANWGHASTVAPSETSSPTPPVITSTAPISVTAGQLYSYDMTATGVPAPSLSVTGAPAWLALSGNTLSGTPSDSDVGTTGTITLTASNGSGPDALEQFTITVDPRPEAPAITSTPSNVAAVAQAYSYTVTVTGYPQPTITASNFPAWLILSGDTLSGTPSAGDVGTTGMIQVRASNGVGSDATQSFEIQVQLEQAPAITSTAPLDAEVGDQYRYTIVATGSPQPMLSITGLPAWLSLNGDVLSGTPAASDAGPMGITTAGPIVITASNGVGTPAKQNFTLSVLDTSRLIAPVIQSIPATDISLGSEYSYTMRVLGSPTPTVTVTGLPDWLSFDSATMAITGTPTLASDVGLTAPIVVEADNGVGQNAVQSFQIAVLPTVQSATSESSDCALQSGTDGWSLIWLLAALALLVCWTPRARQRMA